jgi:SAM-dependent methyltransferase
MSKSEGLWEYFGKNDPYFAVNSISEMRTENIDQDQLRLFFEGGEAYVAKIWKEIEEHFVPHFRPRRALDFGCGVGRLTIPIARRSGQTVGVDISAKMLEVAEQNARNFELDNLQFIKGDDRILKVTGEFDFIHSFIVFQHIKPTIGEPIFRRMIEMLVEGGIGVVQFTYANSVSTSAQKFRSKLYRNVPFAYAARNFMRGAKSEPFIPMYTYNLNRLMLILQQNNCHVGQFRFSNHGIEGVLLFFQKRSEVY